MASVPARQPSQRRASPEQTSSANSQEQSLPSPVRARSATSEDSQTLFLTTPPTESAQQPQERGQNSKLPATAGNGDGETEPKKCWICFSDSTEDTPETSPWRNPCPCALEAHEECLLDWIADKEAPKNSRNQAIGAHRIECPQCKSEIKLARPKDYIVEAVRAVERLGARAVTPGALTVLCGMVYNGSMALGLHSIYAVFGPDDGFRILAPLIHNMVRPPIAVQAGDPRGAGKALLQVMLDHLVHWRLYIGLPLIAPVLVLSRTTYADSVLPVLPILFFATQANSAADTLDFGQWPPSASLAFAVLPYMRSAYNAGYRKLFAEKEKQWLKQIQPRNGEPQQDGNGNVVQGEMADGDAGDENIFEVRIDGGIWEEFEENEDEVQQPAPEAQRAPPLHQPPQPDEDTGPVRPTPGLAGQGTPQSQNAPHPAPLNEAEQAQPPPNIMDGRVDGGPPANPPAPQQPVQAGRRLSFDPLAIAETVLGAILFPTIAGISGELLKLVLPRAWYTPSTPSWAYSLRLGIPRTPAKGLLQEKWGRSLVGGCLFVVCKDALMLYVRWKMAQMHRRRRVLDYDRRTARA